MNMPTAEIVELHEDVSGSQFYGPDLAPVPASSRKWGVRDMAVLWVSMAACIPTYTLASSLIDGGMNWWQAVLTVFLGNVVVLVPMVLNAHAGTRYGIPFPVYCRASFGILGANVPALLRALVACGWFGIQTWIGGAAIHTMLVAFVPSMAVSPRAGDLGITGAQLACFLGFWAVNVLVIYLGIDSIRVLLNIKAPLLIVLGLMLLAWAYWRADGFGPMLSQPSYFGDGKGMKHASFWAFFFPALTANVGFWATLSLNIPDFSRYDIIPGKETYTVSFNSFINEKCYAFVCFMKNAEVSLCFSDLRISGLLTVYNAVNIAVSNYGKQEPPANIGVDAFEFWCPKRRPNGKNVAMKIEPALNAFSTQFLRNGVQRPVSSTNAWVADLNDHNPFVSVSWKEEVVINKVELFFDTDYDHPLETVLLANPETTMVYCVQHFKLLDDKNQVLAEINGNYLTRRVIEFSEPVKTRLLKIVLDGPNVNAPASLFEIRCY